jgi:demethylmenaquinone methyltransferase/2-methoxy-6-polyprenyl-1,4-benzoquinol methylase
MNSSILPDQQSTESKSVQVENMFDRISTRYDLLNRIMTFGIDKRWRKKAIRMLRETNPKQILDIATGTADFALAALELNPDKVTGIDISANMLAVGRDKIRKAGMQNKVELINGSAENLPFHDLSFDAITIGYGVRNFEDLGKGIREIYRVLKPGGVLVILETSQPSAGWKKLLVNFYTGKIVPLMGRLISSNGVAYRYLVDSARHFPYGKEFLRILDSNHFRKTSCTPLFFGVSSIYYAVK